MLEELSSALNQLGRLAELVAARLSRGDSASAWLPQLLVEAKRVQEFYASADAETRDTLRDTLSETAEVIRLAATCGEEWLNAHRSEVDADACASRLRRVYGLDTELAPYS